MKKTFYCRAVALLLTAVMVLFAAGCGKISEPPLMDTATVLLEAASQPAYGPVGGDWCALGLARWGGEVPQTWFDSYYAAVEDYVKACDGVLSDRKYTEYSRVILSLTAMGKDPTDVAGFNLLVPLADYEQTLFQGINGPAFALLALDCGNYEIPENVADSTQATRQAYVDYILSAQLPDGGWSLAGGEAEIDVTAMVLQALAKYQDREDVAQATQKGLAVLSARQNENGGYRYSSTEQASSESISQVIVALSELGIPLDDPRFVKKGHTLMDALLQYYQADGGFSHVMGGESDLLATEQAFYAMVAAQRIAQGEASLYRMK